MYQQRIKTLKSRRLYLNMTIEVLSDLIGVSDKHVGKWERGETIPNAQNFEAWCNALDINLLLVSKETMIDTWQPGTEFKKEIATEFKGVNYEYEIANFRDWYTSKGGTSANWNALFRMWIRRSFKFNGGASQSYQKDSQIVSSVHDRLNAVQNIRTETSRT
jgi:transcriptional regulator with XRE-family HTH domain